jgi:hypothetical protein
LSIDARLTWRTIRAMKNLTILAAAALSGCAGLQQQLVDERKTVSSGFIGCPPAEIAISDGQSLTWTAQCRGKTFYCVVGNGTSCKAAI